MADEKEKKGRCKVLLTADWHLGKRQYGSNKRMRDMEDAAFSVVETAERLGCGYILNAGDIIDTNYPPFDAMEALKRMHDRLKARGMHMYCISGNHDSYRAHWATLLEESGESQDAGGICVIDNKAVVAPDGAVIYGIKSFAKPGIMEALNGAVPEDADFILAHTSVKEWAGFAGDKDLFSLQDIPVDRFRHSAVMCIGDIHKRQVNTLIGANGAVFTALSPGSIEMVYANEEINKTVTVYDPGQKPELRTCAIDPKYLRISSGTISSEEEFDLFYKGLLEKYGMDALQKRRWIMYVRYTQECYKCVARLKELCGQNPEGMLKLIPEPKRKPAAEADGLQALAESVGETRQALPTLAEYAKSAVARMPWSEDAKRLFERLCDKDNTSHDADVAGYISQRKL